MYTIQVQLPLIGVGSGGVGAGIPSHDIVSNPIQVRVQAPEGEDAEVFRAIRQGEVLHLLRTGRPWDVDEVETILKVAGLLREHPRTGYRECLSWALREYNRPDRNLLKPDDRERIRRLVDGPDE